MSTHIWESSIIDAQISVVWDLVRPLNFSYSPFVSTVTLDAKENANEVGSTRTVTYKDKTVQKLRVTELSDAKHAISWDLVESVPAHHVMSASYSIRLRPVTQGAATFVEWTVDFSKDVTADVTADATHKAREHFKQIRETAKAKQLQSASTAQIGKDKVSVPQLQRQLSAKSQQLAKLFSDLDRNKNGKLEFDEFALAVNKLYGENLPDEAVRMLLRQADTNNDSVVSYDEFVKFLAAEGLEQKAQAADAKQPDLVLHYFNLRGRAEVARLVMAEGGLKYEDKRYEKDVFTRDIKPKAPFGQIPYLVVDGKTTIAQSQAINRYVAKLAGLYGRTAEDGARIDMTTQLCYEDVGTEYVKCVYEPDAAKKAEKLNTFLTVFLPEKLALIEKQLKALPKGSQWVLGATFSLADIVLYDLVHKFTLRRAEVANACPLLLQLCTRVASRPRIAAWIKARPASEL